MEKVLGIGGVFFRSRDPEALSEWYSSVLGVAPPPADCDTPSWQQEAGSTVFAPMAAESSHFGRAEQQWSINFRVADLNAMVQQLVALGIAVELDPEHYPNGIFASLSDPEGNPIQLWQAEGVDE